MRIDGYWSGYVEHRYSRPSKPTPRRKLKKERRANLIERTIAVFRLAEPSEFAFEGFRRRDLRSRLCLEGWGWSDADAAAADIIEAAFARLGAKRPEWKKGQPEWTQDGYTFIERTRCVNCSNRLQGESRLYCSPICTDRHRYKLRHRWESAYDFAVRHEVRWIAESGRTAGRG